MVAADLSRSAEQQSLVEVEEVGTMMSHDPLELFGIVTADVAGCIPMNRNGQS